LDALKEKLFAWLKEILVSGIMDNLNNTFTNLNSKVGEVTGQLAQSPSSFEPAVFSMIRNISENVIMPIAGLILTFIACYELIQLIIAHNNLANFRDLDLLQVGVQNFCRGDADHEYLQDHAGSLRRDKLCHQSVRRSDSERHGG
jgi:hypothetical protein